MTKTLKLKKTSPALKEKSLKHLLKQFRDHFNQKIKKHFNSKEIFTVRDFKETEIIKKIKELSKNKASTFKDTPVKMMINSVYIYSQILKNIFNGCVKSGNFPDILKYADITPAFRR